MKMIALVSLLLAVPVMAQEPVVVDTSTAVEAPAPVVSSGPTKTDSKLMFAWNFATDDGKAIHFLDNATAATLYDFNRKEWLAGAMTALYTPQMTVGGMSVKPLSLDAGVVQSIEAGHTAFPFGAVRFHGREMLEQNASLKDFFAARTNLLKYLTCGGWAARDWNIGEYRYGGFVGAETKF